MYNILNKLNNVIVYICKRLINHEMSNVDCLNDMIF